MARPARPAAARRCGRCATSAWPRGRRVGRPDRPQRGWQDHVAEAAGGHQPSDARPGAHRGRVASLINLGRGLPPRADRPREHPAERRDPGPVAARGARSVSKQIVEFADLGAVHRHAAQALLVGHVRAPGLRRGRARRSRRAAGRRGAVGRRRGVSGPLDPQDAVVSRRRSGDPVRVAQPVGGRDDVPARGVAGPRPGALAGPTADVVRAYLDAVDEALVEAAAGTDGPTRTADARRGQP